MNWFLQPASKTQITHLQRLWLYVLTVLTLIFLVAPTLIVIPMSFSPSDFLEFPPRGFSLRWYENYFNSPDWMNATIVSFRAAILSMLCATVLGTAAAYGIWAGRARGRTLLWSLFAMPMAIPIIILAIGALFVLARLGLVNTTTGLVAMHTALALPLVLIVVTAGLASYDINQEQAARSLGATRPYAFFTVTLPQIKFSVISAMLFSFFASFDEVVVAMFISNGPYATLNRRMFNSLRDSVDPTIAAISTCLIAVSIVLLVLGQVFKPRTNH
ncbi:MULTISPECIES: ABC transporter permease [Rhizobium/Agrobacterium group]|uniref:TM component of ABC transporter of mannopine n=1 Tax=Agrobacterium tumefaciens TaxID=358 RepID=K7WUK0_AGRTU|nr:MULTISPECIES: ABC transporter permease [Rhizobium/Agrobacterium group]AFX65624.1 TM component of ABC transporter of mannopine [Agrobacterium radiobacter]KEA02993.1 ABC transporter permease [Rhizobium rhizogenes]NTI39015.1 ABC transporter permease [Rhizobium rhizogenes]NTI85199.1 ABC transporter permease [Rhizobium rhizogenes]NTJ27385.1 ABC transporter permease [Rhizobium rhizogenes]